MAGDIANWISKLHPIVAVSYMEVEYIACFFCIQDVVWIRQLLKDLGLERTLLTTLQIDNRSAAHQNLPRTPFTNSGPSIVISSTTGSGA
jgi:hypothetical protein